MSNFTEADVQAMATAIKNGHQTVRLSSGESITYQYMGELLKAYRMAKQELAEKDAQAGVSSVPYSVADWTIR